MVRKKSKKEESLRAFQWKRFIRAPDAHLLEELYIPALSHAVHYDRCCAYFTSHVLSVAARGFGGFIQNLLDIGDLPKPAARLLVNEQLDAQDLDALLAKGDQSKLIDKLLKQFKTPKNALKKNRLQMLAWLVASGWLEVRVGVMRRTGGVAHAKFGIATDINGDSIAFMGSDNETGSAIVENYEELEIRPSWHDQDFVDYYRGRFEKLWENSDESVMTMPLPEAVKAKIIKIATKKPPREMKWDKQAITTAMLWHFIAAAPYLPDGEHACDATAMVDVWPHQRRVVEDTARTFPAGRLLCDEVGMGKTIEAMLILRRLLCGRGVRRALVLVPAGLLRQWQDELREKGGLLIPRWESGYLYSPNGVYRAVEAEDALRNNDVLLMSREWARLDANRQIVLSSPKWDLVLLDEAHAARRSSSVEGEFNSANLLLQMLRELQLRRQATGIILLSATPMQTQPWEPWDLLAVLGIGGRWIADFDDIRSYYGGVEALRSGNIPHNTTAEAIGHLVADDDEFPSSSDSTPNNDATAVKNALIFAFSDSRRHYADWLRSGAPLGRRMHRNTRDTLRQYYQNGLLDYPPPSRDVRDEIFDYQIDEERECYNAIGDYIEERYEQLEQEKGGKGFVMTVYRRRAASSPLALRRSLERRSEKLEKVIRKQWSAGWLDPLEEQIDTRDLSDADVDERIDPALPDDPKVAEAEKEEIKSLLSKLDLIRGTDSKFDVFWSALRDITADGRSVLVFTEYADTMEHLRDQLRPVYGATLGCYSGAGGQVWNGSEWKSVSKSDITERLFNGDLRILVCTDAASEGLNLQAASALINYDLPWNPSKVEQRIGRIDRIGQQQSTLPIRNLFLRDSVDMTVYVALRMRCRLFERFVGRMQPILSLARNVLRGSLRPEIMEEFIKELDKRIQELDANHAVNNAFAESEADRPTHVDPLVIRQDIETALESLEKSKSGVRAKRIDEQLRWRLSGLRTRNVEVTSDRGTLEQDQGVTPITASSEILKELTEKLHLPSCAPLVLAEYSSGACRCIEARWVESDEAITVSSFKQLMELVQSWDGASPNSTLVTKTEENARELARQRVEEMCRTIKNEEENGIRRQREAARYRLMRELGRTLRCIGLGDLTDLLRKQVQREANADGRYHQAAKLLGGFPKWDNSEIENINWFVNSVLDDRGRRARILGSEVDAALEDPRWRVSTE